MAQLSKCFLTGDFTDWPLDQETACQVCRVRFVRGPEKIVEKFAELRVRSQVIKEMANIYIGRHIQDLGRRSHVLKLCASPPAGTLHDQFRAHIESRVNEEYPEDTFGEEHGAVPEKIQKLAEKQSEADSKEPSAFEMKQATMPDTPTAEAHLLFSGQRPTIVVDEAATSNTFPHETILQAAAPKVASLDVKMSNEFQDQFISL